MADQVLRRYAEVGVIDDQAFARAWVSSRHHGQGLARRALAGELRRKGIEPDTVGAALDELDPHTERATARSLVARQLRGEPMGWPADPRRSATVFRRLVGMLARKGYPPGLAYRVVTEALAERAEDAEFMAALDEQAIEDEIFAAEQREAEQREAEQREAEQREAASGPVPLS